VVSTDCVARRCSARHALAGIAIATMTSSRRRPLAEVCTVPVLLVLSVFDGRLTGYVLLLTYRYLHGLERPLQSSYSGRL